MHRLEKAGVFRVEDNGPTYVEQFRGHIWASAHTRSQRGLSIPQGTHTEDEVFVVVSGRAMLWTGPWCAGPRRTDRLRCPCCRHRRRAR